VTTGRVEWGGRRREASASSTQAAQAAKAKSTHAHARAATTAPASEAGSPGGVAIGITAQTAQTENVDRSPGAARCPVGIIGIRAIAANAASTACAQSRASIRTSAIATSHPISVEHDVLHDGVSRVDEERAAHSRSATAAAGTGAAVAAAMEPLRNGEVLQSEAIGVHKEDAVLVIAVDGEAHGAGSENLHVVPDGGQVGLQIDGAEHSSEVDDVFPASLVARLGHLVEVGGHDRLAERDHAVVVGGVHRRGNRQSGGPHRSPSTEEQEREIHRCENVSDIVHPHVPFPPSSFLLRSVRRRGVRCPGQSPN
jgi:hypothetical protein